MPGALFFQMDLKVGFKKKMGVGLGGLWPTFVFVASETINSQASLDLQDHLWDPDPIKSDDLDHSCDPDSKQFFIQSGPFDAFWILGSGLRF